MQIINQNLEIKANNLPKLGDVPIKERAQSSDDLVMGALNQQLKMITQLGDQIIAESSQQAAIQKQAGKNSQSRVEMYRALLDAHSVGLTEGVFKGAVKGWGTDQNRINQGLANGNLDDVFMQYLNSIGQGKLFKELYENPNVTKEDKIEFARQYSEFWGKTNGRLSSMPQLSSPISANLQAATTEAQDWQSLADSLKPTQLQQAITQLIAEIGQSLSAWEKVIAM
jgi:hypothetical protein